MSHEKERAIYQEWEEKGYFKPALDSTKAPFIMMIPPPNVTGVLHMGHGLNNSLQDILARYHRMSGRPTLWLPGTDHAGIATQHVVERRLKERGTSRHELGREAFVDEAWKVKEEHHAIIKEQLKRIGSSCDWSRERFTLDEGLSMAVRESFVTLYERDLIYQGEYLTNWCSSCGTAIADDEVEHHLEHGALYYIKYQLDGMDTMLTVATSRPETLFGDSAVAVHPDDIRYSHLIGKKILVPLTGRYVTIIADSYVDRAFGTACLKVTPAHDPNDYEIGQRHQLEVINILTDEGTLNSNVPKAYQGLTVKQARKAVIEALQQDNLLVKQEHIEHRVGHCYRCNTVIEPYMSRQWFVRMKPMADKALKAWEEGQINFYPKRWENTYSHWMRNIKDWCISRQLWWGHRIPAWRCVQCGHLVVARVDPACCSACASSDLIQDEDVLDTWFSSWLWPFSTLGWPASTDDLTRLYPTTALVTAYDIIFFWVARMVMAGLEFTGQVPFRDIYITPLVRDKDGRKMSKSLGNGIDPLEVVDEYGADALKFTIAYLSSQSQDLNLDKESFKLGSGFCNKIRNASRYLLVNSQTIALVKEPTLNNLDRWAYGRLNLAVRTMAKAVADYRFDDMAHAIYDYFWKDFCDWYIEGTKLSLYGDDEGEKSRAISVAFALLDESLRLMHPLLPFITEEIFQELPGNKALSIMTSSYPQFEPDRNDGAIDEAFTLMQQIIGNVRSVRAGAGVPLNKKINIAILLNETSLTHLVREHAALIKSLAKAESVSFISDKASVNSWVECHGVGYSAFAELESFIDVEGQRAKNQKELVKMIALRDSALSKLGNAAFMGKASSAAITKEQSKLDEANLAISKLSL